jgi:hypothetical protein
MRYGDEGRGEGGGERARMRGWGMENCRGGGGGSRVVDGWPTTTK